jgi:mycothiol system anti-sigma-R factor
MSDCTPTGDSSCTCGDALSRVYDYLDQEIDAASAMVIAGHLEACPDCAEQYRLEQMVKALVHRTCCEERAPEALRIRIVARISEVRITYRREG